MRSSNDFEIIRTKVVVLPYGCSNVTEVIDQEEELIMIDAFKENKDIIFAYKDLDGFLEFGCKARVSLRTQGRVGDRLRCNQLGKVLTVSAWHQAHYKTKDEDESNKNYKS